MTRAGNSFLLLPMDTLISSASATTWLAVRIYPSGETMTPEPRLCSLRVRSRSLLGARSPKNCRKTGSFSSGLRRSLMKRVVKIFTTPGATFLTMGAKLVPRGASRLMGVAETLKAGWLSRPHEVKCETASTAVAPSTAVHNPKSDRDINFIADKLTQTADGRSKIQVICPAAAGFFAHLPA